MNRSICARCEAYLTDYDLDAGADLCRSCLAGYDEPEREEPEREEPERDEPEREGDPCPSAASPGGPRA